MAKLVDALHSKCSDFGHESSSLSPPIQSVLCPDAWPFELRDLPKTIHLVGGCVRDAFLGHSSGYLDLDFVVEADAVGVAKEIAQRYRAGYVLLDEARQIARVVFNNTTADFALQVGDSLQEDLTRRDFTVNAIAYNPHVGKIIDPLDGYRDLQRGIIRMIHEDNLKDDPLRLLRAYRQAAQLNFSLDWETQNAIREFSGLLSQVATERIRVELGYLLSSASGTPWVTQLFQDGLLDQCFPQSSAQSIAQLSALDEAEVTLNRIYPELVSALHQRLSNRAQGAEALRRTVLSTIKLLGLVSPNPELAEAALTQLKYSRNEIRLVCSVLQAQQTLSQSDSIFSSKTQQYQLFQQVGKYFPALVLAAIATQFSLDQLHPLIREFLSPDSPIAHPRPLLSGTELMAALTLDPGPGVGQLLQQIAIAHAEGHILTKSDAIAYAGQLAASSGPDASGPNSSGPNSSGSNSSGPKDSRSFAI